MEADEFDLAGFCIGVGGARPAARRDRGAGRATRSWGSPRPASTRTATRWSGRWSRSTSSTSARRISARCGGCWATPRPQRRSSTSPARARDAGRGAADADPRSTPGTCSRSAPRSSRDGTTSAAIAHITGGGLPGNVPRALPAALGRAPRPAQLADALGDAPARRARAGSSDDGAARDVQRRPRAWSSWSPRVGGARGRSTLARERGDPGLGRRRGRRRGRARRSRGTRRRRDAMSTRTDRGRRVRAAGPTCGRSSRPRIAATLGGERRPGVRRPRRARRSTGRRSRGSRRSSCPAATTRTLAETLDAVAPDAVVLAGYLRLLGPGVLARVRGPDPQRPSVAAAGVPGPARACATRSPPASPSPASPSTSSTRPSTAARSWPRRRSRSCPATTRRRSLARHPRRRAPAAAGGGRRACSPGRWPARGRPPAAPRPGAARRPRPGPAPGAALGLRQDRPGGPGRAASSPAASSSCRTGGTARALREAGLPVTDVAAVTGFPEMLDGRVKTLHPRVHAGLLADRRRADHREALAAAGIAPFELVVVNLYPFAEAARKPGLVVRRARRGDRHRRAVDGPRGRQEPRQRRDRDLARPLRGRPGGPRRPTARSRSGCARRWRSRRSATPPRTTPGSPRSCRAGCATPASTCRPSPGCPGPADPYPPVLTISLEKVETLRYGENPHQPAARYRRTDREPRAGEGPFASGEPPLQGKALSYNNVLDALGGGRRWRGCCAARPSSSSSTPTRAAPPSARRCSRPGTRRSRATRCPRSAASSRSPGPSIARSPSG